MSANGFDVKQRARHTYQTIKEIWPPSDAWSVHTETSIRRVVQKSLGKPESQILNAGCGTNEYGLPNGISLINLDFSLPLCRAMRNSVTADIEALPFPDCTFELTLCVGAVINYVEPYQAIPELIRVTKRGGILLLDFESSLTAEMLFKKDWAARVSIIERLYAGRVDKTYLFHLTI